MDPLENFSICPHFKGGKHWKLIFEFKADLKKDNVHDLLYIDLCNEYQVSIFSAIFSAILKRYTIFQRVEIHILFLKITPKHPKFSTFLNSCFSLLFVTCFTSFINKLPLFPCIILSFYCAEF